MAPAAVRIASYEDWPDLFSAPRERLLARALVAIAIVLSLGLLN